MIENGHKLICEGPKFDGTIHGTSGEVGLRLRAFIESEEPAKIRDKLGVSIQICFEEFAVFKQENV